MPRRRSAVLFAVAGAIALIAASPTFAAKGGIPGPPDKSGGEETAVNNLSLPLLMTGDALGTIPNDVPMGSSSLSGQFYLWDGVNPPCDPAESTCFPSAQSDPTLSRVYIQKDPNNNWQAYSQANLVTLDVDAIDVGDNLESVPWRTTSVVRVEFVPFGDTTLTGFAMAYVSGQGVNEVWGVVAPNTPSPSAVVESAGFGTLYSDTMGLTLTKLESDAGSIETEPDPAGTAYDWDAVNQVWVRADTTAVAQTIPVDFTAEINVKGRLIYGFNWMLKRTAMTPGVSKDGWWRLTFSSSLPTSPLNFTTGTLKYDPIAGPPAEEIVAAAEESEGSNPNYPREPVILPEADLVYIDVYIGSSSGGGKGGGGNQGGGNGNKPN